MKKFEDLKAKIKGPVFPILVPFTENEEVDFIALQKYVQFLVKAGAPVLLLTVGTSRFNLLGNDEILQINKTVVEAAEGKAVVITAGPGPMNGSTKENVRFAQHSEQIGADGILLVYPERWYGDEPVVDFFQDVAASVSIGVMIHAVPMRDGFGGVKALKYFDVGLVKKVAEHPNIIGLKEENGDRGVFEAILRETKEELVIIGAGGCMRRFLKDFLMGSITYLVGIGSFRPELALAFYQSVLDGNIKVAEEIAETFEDPYFDFAVKLGWHRALKETLSALNLMPPFERRPLTCLTQEEREGLKQVLQKCGWLKQEALTS